MGTPGREPSSQLCHTPHEDQKNADALPKANADVPRILGHKNIGGSKRKNTRQEKATVPRLFFSKNERDQKKKTFQEKTRVSHHADTPELSSAEHAVRSGDFVVRQKQKSRFRRAPRESTRIETASPRTGDKEEKRHSWACGVYVGKTSGDHLTSQEDIKVGSL